MTDAERPIADINELLELVSLDDVVFFEVSGRGRDGIDDETLAPKEPTAEIDVLRRVGPKNIEVRCRAEIETPDARYAVDAAARYSIREAVALSPELVEEFADRVGVMTVYPYLRESVHGLAAKLRRGPVTLGLLRPGDIRLINDTATGSSS